MCGSRDSPSLWASEGENLKLHSCGNLGNTSDTLVLNTPWGPRKAAVILQFLHGFYLSSSDQDTHCPIQALIIFMMPLRIWLDTDLVPGWNGAGLWSHQFFVWWVLFLGWRGSFKPPLICFSLSEDCSIERPIYRAAGGLVSSQTLSVNVTAHTNCVLRLWHTNCVLYLWHTSVMHSKEHYFE